MGGDRGPDMVVPALDMILERHPGVKILLFGDQSRISPLVSRCAAAASSVSVRHTDVWVAMDDKPSQALRRGAVQEQHVAGDRCGEAPAKPTSRFPPAIPAR